MLQSNQPYQRVDDGIGAGLVAGSIMGLGGAVGGGVFLDQMEQHSGRNFKMNPKETIAQNQQRAAAEVGKWENRFDKYYGGEKMKIPMTGHAVNKRAALTTGIGILGGALMGASIDGLNG